MSCTNWKLLFNETRASILANRSADTTDFIYLFIQLTNKNSYLPSAPPSTTSG